MKNRVDLNHVRVRSRTLGYAGIAREFGFSRAEDGRAARVLDSIIRRPVPAGRIGRMIRGRTVFVVGSGPSLSSSIPFLKKYDNPKIVADSALRGLAGRGVRPDIVVTDLDGDAGCLRRSGRAGSIMVVHAHGDNIARLHMAGDFRNCLGTSQGGAPGRLRDFGGFTDGDRCVFIADAFGAQRVVLFGMDFGKRIGRHSGTRRSERVTKLKKLARAEELLGWLAKRSACEMYTTSRPIRGFKKIRYNELAGIAAGGALASAVR